jgi:hypothetical protein
LGAPTIAPAPTDTSLDIAYPYDEEHIL